MPRLLATAPGFVTAAGAGTNAVAISPGSSSSFTIPAANSGNIYLESLWASGSTVDFVRVRSGRLHDVSQGIRMWVGGNQRRPLIPWGGNQKLISVDNLTVEADATGAGTQAVVLTYGYDDFAGSGQRLTTWGAVQPRIQEIMGQEVDVTSSATIGTYGANANLNSFADNWKANMDYALLGFTCSVATACISINGPETSGQDIGFPGDTDALQTRDYFVKLDMWSGRPSIPVINANNKGSTFLKSMDVAASTATKVSLIFARLG